MLNDTFSGSSVTTSHDNNGNLTFDGTYRYTYNAWNELVKATLDDADVVIQQAEFYANSSRATKTVTESGDLDGVWVYYYDGMRMIHAVDGSDNLRVQVYHGVQYVDEIVGMRFAHGRVYVNQDANWNVTSLTDLSGKTMEKISYTAYGEPSFTTFTGFGDYDGDGDVDVSDDAELCASGCDCEYTGSVSGDCRLFDFDCDGDLDADDQTTMSSLYSMISSDMQNKRVSTGTSSPLGNVFAHQGLIWDAELGSYQNRARQYSPGLQRFMQKDALASLPLAGNGYHDGLNLYAYVRSNPINNKDPNGNGLYWEDEDDFGGFPAPVAPDTPGETLPDGNWHCCKPPVGDGTWARGGQCPRGHSQVPMNSCSGYPPGIEPTKPVDHDLWEMLPSMPDDPDECFNWCMKKNGFNASDTAAVGAAGTLIALFTGGTKMSMVVTWSKAVPAAGASATTYIGVVILSCYVQCGLA